MDVSPAKGDAPYDSSDEEGAHKPPMPNPPTPPAKAPPLLPPEPMLLAHATATGKGPSPKTDESPRMQPPKTRTAAAAAQRELAGELARAGKDERNRKVQAKRVMERSFKARVVIERATLACGTLRCSRLTALAPAALSAAHHHPRLPTSRLRRHRRLPRPSCHHGVRCPARQPFGAGRSWRRGGVRRGAMASNALRWSMPLTS